MQRPDANKGLFRAAEIRELHRRAESNRLSVAAGFRAVETPCGVQIVRVDSLQSRTVRLFEPFSALVNVDGVIKRFVLMAIPNGSYSPTAPLPWIFNNPNPAFSTPQLHRIKYEPSGVKRLEHVGDDVPVDFYVGDVFYRDGDYRIVLLYVEGQSSDYGLNYADDAVVWCWVARGAASHTLVALPGTPDTLKILEPASWYIIPVAYDPPRHTASGELWRGWSLSDGSIDLAPMADGDLWRLLSLNGGDLETNHLHYGDRLLETSPTTKKLQLVDWDSGKLTTDCTLPLPPSADNPRGDWSLDRYSVAFRVPDDRTGRGYPLPNEQHPDADYIYNYALEWLYASNLLTVPDSFFYEKWFDYATEHDNLWIANSSIEYASGRDFDAALAGGNYPVIRIAGISGSELTPPEAVSIYDSIICRDANNDGDYWLAYYRICDVVWAVIVDHFKLAEVPEDEIPWDWSEESPYYGRGGGSNCMRLIRNDEATIERFGPPPWVGYNGAWVSLEAALLSLEGWVAFTGLVAALDSLCDGADYELSQCEMELNMWDADLAALAASIANESARYTNLEARVSALEAARG